MSAANYEPREFRFGGLDLASDAQETPGCIDVLNVAFNRGGIIRSRDGTVSAATAAAVPTSMLKWSNTRFVLGTGVRVYVFNGPPYTVLGSTATVDVPVMLVPSPVTDDTAYYCTSSSGSATKKITSGGTVSSPGGSLPTGNVLGVQTPSNRLVVGNSGGTAGKLAFSDAGTPETFTSTSWVQLPNTITNLVTWNDQLFCFTERAIYLFYGNSVGPTGQPEFNFRLVSDRVAGLWADGFGQKMVATTLDGVYFNTTTGVYKTTGGPPVLISQALSPLFNNDSTPPYFTPSLGGFPNQPLKADNHHLYQQVDDDYWFVYDLDQHLWSLWRFPGAGFLLPDMLTSSSELRLILGYPASTTITQTGPSYTSDNGSAIATLYRNGFVDLAAPGVEGTMREWLVNGYGTVDFKTAVDDAATLSAAASLTLGTAPAITMAKDRTAVKGRNVSWQISSASGAWAVSRVIGNQHNARAPGVDGT